MRLLFVLIFLIHAPGAARADAPGDEAAIVEKVYFLDYSKGGSPENNGQSLRIVHAQPNSQDRNRSLVLYAPGGSKVTWEVDLPALPSRAALGIEHLSSGSSARLGGSSVVSLVINNETVVSQWDVGTHQFGEDRLLVTKYLERGRNIISIRFDQGPTCYWFRRMSLSCRFPAGTALDAGRAERIPAGKRSDYAVVVRRGVYEDAAWREVVDTLAAKHDAAVILYPHHVTESLGELTALFPRYACFVAPPTESGRRFVTAVHRITRKLDSDPFGDLIWGILTGFEAADALRIARENVPLVVRRAAAGCNVDLNDFREGTTFSETRQSVMMVREPGKEPLEKSCPPDATEAIVRTLREGKPDCFVTSGHATEHDWQIGYSFESGRFLCDKGQLYGMDGKGQRFDIVSPNPKVYCAPGNCLIGRIEGPEAMAAAWMHSGGVHQMVGYTVSTWYGYGGHGVMSYFVRLQGRHTLAESFFLNNQALLERLHREYPGSLEKTIDDFNMEGDKNLINRTAMELEARSRDELGLQWDRDTVAFYGDPAWEARVERVRDPDYDCKLSRTEIEAGTFRFVFDVTANRDGKPARPPAALLPFRVTDVKVEAGDGPVPLVTDDFILLPVAAELEAGQEICVRFTARRR